MGERKDEKPCEVDVRLKILYEDLSEEVRHRGQMYATIQSILITGSLLAVSFIIKDLLVLHWLLVVGTLLVATLLVYYAKSMYETTKKLDEIFLERMEDIENDPKMQIERGRAWLYHNKIKCTSWYNTRLKIWPHIFRTLLGFYGFVFLVYIVLKMGIIP